MPFYSIVMFLKFSGGEAILTTTYLINRLPLLVINIQTALHVLQRAYPSNDLYHTMYLKVFGCTAYVHDLNPSLGKLDPKAQKCIFLGYSPTQKGYKCYSPKTKKMFVSLDVIFFENNPYYLQGESLTKEGSSNLWNTSILTESENVSSPPSTTQTSLPKSQSPLESTKMSLQGTDIETESTKMSLQGADLETESESQRPGQETELRVYSRRPKPSTKVQALMPLVLDHESEPNNNPCETTTEIVNDGVSFEDLDLPIAVRKGKRSCTKHPISNYVSHSRLCSSFKVMTENMEKTEIPKNIQEAMKIPE